MKSSSLQKLLDFLAELDDRTIHYRVDCIRSEAIMVHVAVPGERWEVEHFADGHVEIEIFRSAPEGINGEEALAELFEKFGD